MLSLTFIQKIAIWTIPVLLAITLHEAAHAWAADRLGDSTAKMMGRLSINPLRHIDLFGTIVVPLLIAFMTQFQFVFGWAKPVPINGHQLRNPNRDMALVSFAGPAANLLMAFLWALCLKISYSFNPQTFTPALFLALTAQAGIIINLILALLNLLPIPPLDGSKVLASALPPKQAMQYLKLEPYGFLILVILLISGILGSILNPLLYYAITFLTHL